MTTLSDEIAHYARAADIPGLACVVVRLLPEPSTVVAIAATEGIYPASLIKVPIALAALHFWREEFMPSSEVSQFIVRDRHMTFNDAPSPLVSGYAATAKELVELMISRSDNVATNIIIDTIGRERITGYLHSLGLGATHVRRFLSGSLPRIADLDATGENAHPPIDASRCLQYIAHGELPHTGFLMQMLRAQYWNGKLSQGLTADESFAHKTGDTDEYSHDAGVFCADGNRSIVVIYSRMPANDQTDRRFSGLLPLIRRRFAPVSR